MNRARSRRRPRRRLIHRRGVVFKATLHPPDRLPGRGSTFHPRRVLVRVSGTFGLPRPLPEWTGLAIRILPPEAPGGADAAGPAEAGDHGAGAGSGHLDILLVSSLAGPKLWRQMRPSRNAVGCAFSSVSRYRIGGSDQVVVAVPTEPRSASLEELRNGVVACPLRFRLDVAELQGLWRGLGQLELTEQMDDDDHRLRFTPPHGGLVRRLLYRLLQR